MIPVSGKPRVVVVGSGHQLAMTSYALAKKLGTDNIAIVAVDVGHDDAPETITTLSDMRLFNTSLGIDEQEFLSACHADVNLGWMLRRMAQPSDMLFANGRYGVPMNNIPFHQLYHIYKKHNPDVSFDEFSLASCLAKAGKFASASNRVDSLFGTLAYGYSFRSSTCEKYFKRLALHLNVTYIKSDDIAVATSDKGSEKGVEKIVTRTGQVLEADLFIDCSNAGSLVSQVRGVGKYTPIDSHMILPFRNRTSNPEKNDAGCEAIYGEWKETKDGFQSTITHDGLRGIDQVDFLPTEPSAREDGPGYLNASALRQSWSGNCIALGSAYARLPNMLPGTHQLFLKQLLQLLNVWFGQRDWRAIAEVFGQSSKQSLASFIDVVNIQLRAHPSLAAAVDLTELNRRRVELFIGSGALPMTENAVVTDQQWIALLMALGFYQQGSILQASGQTIANTSNQLDTLRHHIQKSAASALPYSEWVNTMGGRK